MSTAANFRLVESSWGPKCVAFCEDLVAIGYYNGVVQIHEIPSGKLRYSARPCETSVCAVAFSKDGNEIAVGGTICPTIGALQVESTPKSVLQVAMPPSVR